MLGSVTVTLQVEGSFVGWRVQAAQRCWQSITQANQGVTVRIDLSAVTLIDGAGRHLLATMRKQGVDVFSAGCRSTLDDGVVGSPSFNDRVSGSAKSSQTSWASIFENDVLNHSQFSWSICLAALVGVLGFAGFYLWAADCDISQKGVALAVFLLLTMLGLAWKSQSESTRRFQSAINTYAAREIVRQQS